MKKYVKVYMDYFDYKTESDVVCEVCGSPAVDIHHVSGRGKGKDVIRNLAALCRKHHTMCHNEKIPKNEMQLIHNYFMQGTRKIFLK